MVIKTVRKVVERNVKVAIALECNGRKAAFAVVVNNDDSLLMQRGGNAEVRVAGHASELPVDLGCATEFQEIPLNGTYALGLYEPVLLRNAANDAYFYVRVIDIDRSCDGQCVLNCEYRMIPQYLRYGDEVQKISHFATRARLIKQLGEQLIKNPAVAMLELVKNSYDADATVCEIQILHPQDPVQGVITILDDGSGMSREIIESAWLQIGTSFKADHNDGASAERTPRFGRIRMGEKGIGRFGVHRLGDCVEIVTRSEKSSREYVIKIDWRKVDKSYTIEDLPVQLVERDPQVFVVSTGTRIRITSLKAEWNRKTTLEIARSVAALNSPFDAMDGFRARFSVVGTPEESSWLSKLSGLEEVVDQALFFFEIRMRGTLIENFKYEFRPWKNMTKARARVVKWNSACPLARIVTGKDVQTIDISELGEVKFKGVIFDQDARLLSLGVLEKRGLRSYLRANCGVRVFRDNMRVLDYGEPGNDWLGLDARRAKRTASHIGNGVMLGAVYLLGDTRRALPEKANREGFIENDLFDRLRESLLFCMSRLDSEWEMDKRMLSRLYAPTRENDRIPVQSPIGELKEKIQTLHGISDEEKMSLYMSVDKIKDDYETIVENLIKSAGAGLNLIMVLHQMEKLVRGMKRAIEKDVDAGFVRAHLKTLDDLIGGYSVMVRQSSRKMLDLAPIVDQAIFNTSFRFESHKIKVEKMYFGKVLPKAYAADSHVLNAMMNIFDNSIWWLGYSQTEDKGLYVDLVQSADGMLDLIVADNGPGFTKPTSEIVRPFVTDKPGGMGIGLHLTDEVMKSLGGKLLFPTPVDIGLPERYHKGATVVLRFRTEEVEG